MGQESISGSALWGALGAVAGFITERTGVQVVRGSQQPCTDGKAVYLPPLPDLLLSRSEVMKTIGLLYHETAHVLKSDFSISWDSPLQRAVAGILEDVRIEAFAIGKFPAARGYLAELVGVYADAGVKGETPCFPVVTESESDPAVLQWYMLYRLRHEVLQQTAVAPVLASAVAVAESRFPRGMLVRLDALMFEIQRCTCEADVKDLSDAIVKMLHEEEAKQEEEQEAAAQSSAGGESMPQAPGSGPSVAGEDGGGVQSPGELQDGQGSGRVQGAVSRVTSMGDEDVIQSIGDIAQQDLTAISQVKAGASGAVCLPNVYPMKLGEGGAEDLTEIRASINAIRTRCLSWMAAAAQSDVRYSRRGVILDASQLHVAPFGGDVFVEETEGIDLNAAIAIVIDRSGSMSSILSQAVLAAIAAMLAFEVPGIKTQVSVFPVAATSGSLSTEEGVAVLKRWDDSPQWLAGRLGRLRAGGSTPMAEATLFGAMSVLHREETLKLVIVVTDGDPNDADAMRAVLQKVRGTGIHVVGLGIGVDPSPVFGEKYSGVVLDVRELAGAMVKAIRTTMKR